LKPQCRWHCPAKGSGDFDSLTLPITGRQCYCGIMLDWGRIRHRIFRRLDPDPQNVTDLSPWWVVSLTLPTTGQRCHWHCALVFIGVFDTANHKKIDFIFKYFREFEAIMQKGFDPWVRGSDGVVRWKKTGGQKSRDRVPLSKPWKKLQNFWSYLLKTAAFWPISEARGIF
jgi:hypothetical protein